ncbi:Ctf8p and Ctf18p associating protein [Coemansia aciculifera]|uniref:Ctf8p and Ctf18p associating protein n=1 Tax=Coemansia aciculifera TaxID=417176 RepID=A0ACC1LWA5_9FUNG|nr:Ctf8p and Ctf18p associating protein [Coemansia aciculifera]
MEEDARTFGLSASDGYPEEAYRLLELTPELLTQLEGSTTQAVLTVRGRESDMAILIDPNDRAYQLHTAHTSNNLYLLSLSPGQQLCLRSKVNQIFELQPTHPQIRPRLMEVLGWDTRGAFRGAELDATETEGRVVTDDVLSRHVAAGDRLRSRVLADIPAFRMAETGAWRVVDPGYCMELLRLALATAVENDWPLDAIDPQAMHQALRSDDSAIPPELISAVLARFSRPAPSSPSSTYAIDSSRVAKYLAEQIFLAEGMRPWPVPEFLMALRATMPPQLQAADIADREEGWRSTGIPRSIVRDLAYASTPIDIHLMYTHEGVPHHATYLNPLLRKELPDEPRARLRRLFEVKPKWSKSEVLPFLEDLVDVDLELLEKGDEPAGAAVSKAIDGWLIKFGRGVKAPNGEMVYTSRIN